MAEFIQGLFGAKPSVVPPGDADFADFASPPDPSPVAFAGSSPAQNNPFATNQAVPFTAWYRVWERTTPKDFIAEAILLPVLVLVLLVSVWGRRSNKSKARNWAAAHSSILQKEFAQVGIVRPRSEDAIVASDDIIEEKNPDEFTCYATGRQNVAFLDITLNLLKRYSPLSLFGETIVAFFFTSFKAPTERMEAVLYPFDGREKDIVPVRTEAEQSALEARVKDLTSGYDGFVWAIVNKDNMRGLRDERYDVSLTFTKDNSKLQDWATVMSENAEITEQLLSPELIKLVENAGPEVFEYLVITDQPIVKPTRLNETLPRKRITLSLKLPSSNSESAYASTLPLFSYFLRLPDHLAATAHYRPEVMRRIKNTREEEIRKLKKIDDEEKAEERKVEADKKKKEERDRKLKGLSAEEQRKYLEKEREKEQRKMGKKRTMKA